MRAYTKNLAQAVAAFASGVVMTPREILDRRDDYAPRTETGAVPGVGNDYSVLLEYGILKQTGFTVTDTTADEELLVIPYGEVPGPGEVAVLFDLGLLVLHATRSTHALSVPYTPLGSVLGADLLDWIQKELEATQAKLLTLFNGTADPDVDDLLVRGQFRTYDNQIELNYDVSGGTPSQNGGVLIRRGDQMSASLLWDEATDSWKVGLASSEAEIVTVSGSQTLTNKTYSSPTLTGTVTLTPSGAIMISQALTDAATSFWFRARDSGGTLTDWSQLVSVHAAGNWVTGSAVGDTVLRSPTGKTAWLTTATTGSAYVRVDATTVTISGMLVAPTTAPASAVKTAGFTPDATAETYYCSGTFVVTLPAPGPIGTNPRWKFVQTGSGSITFSRTIAGDSGFALNAVGESVILETDGTNYYAF